MPRYPEFAAILNHYMAQQERSAAWLAHRLGVDSSTVSRWLNGETRPKSPEVVIQIADCVGIYDPAQRQELLVSIGYGYAHPPALNPTPSPPTQQRPSKIHDLLGQGLDVIPERLADFIVDHTAIYARAAQANYLRPDGSCGEQGIDLGQQRLFASSAFGAYFAGLLEQDSIHIHLDDQIETPPIPGLESFDPFHQLLWALQHPLGPRLLVIAAEGGMGKSTIAARLVRCLVQMNAIDIFLGDSAKKKRVDPLTGDIEGLEPGYYDPETCFIRLREQLALPPGHRASHKRHIAEILDRLAGRRALIILDNLEIVQQGDELLRRIQPLLGRDIRCIITTRQVNILSGLTARRMVAYLKPIVQADTVSYFLGWHIQKYQMVYPALASMNVQTIPSDRLHDLIDKTGGIPLLIQLVFSEVIRSSWRYLDQLPQLWGRDLLEYLYADRWEELGAMNGDGELARRLLRRTAEAQYQGRPVDFDLLVAWVTEENAERHLQNALRLLYERFLIVNRDQEKGDFSLFPSLADFVRSQHR